MTEQISHRGSRVQGMIPLSYDSLDNDHSKNGAPAYVTHLSVNPQWPTRNFHNGPRRPNRLINHTTTAMTTTPFKTDLIVDCIGMKRFTSQSRIPTTMSVITTCIRGMGLTSFVSAEAQAKISTGYGVVLNEANVTVPAQVRAALANGSRSHSCVLYKNAHLEKILSHRLARAPAPPENRELSPPNLNGRLQWRPEPLSRHPSVEIGSNRLVLFKSEQTRSNGSNIPDY